MTMKEEYLHREYSSITWTCYNFGDCNPCDVKIKTNRFQEYGHTSVEIININNTDYNISQKKNKWINFS
jgi:hypothetical protein